MEGSSTGWGGLARAVLWPPILAGLFPATPRVGGHTMYIGKGMGVHFFFTLPIVLTVPFLCYYQIRGKNRIHSPVQKRGEGTLSSLFCIDSTFPLSPKVRRVAESVLSGKGWGYLFIAFV